MMMVRGKATAIVCIFLFYLSSIGALTLTKGSDSVEIDQQEENVDDIVMLVDEANEISSSTTTSITLNRTSKIKQQTGPDFRRKWVSQIFLDAQNQFDMHPNVSLQCKRDYELYKMHLQNQSVWAVRMLESAQWPSFGIFGGTVDHLGSFDECLLVSSHGVKGQYCLAQGTYDYPEDANDSFRISEAMEHPNEEESAWKAMNMYLANPVRVNRHEVSWALCIPASCKNTDLNLTLNEALKPLFNKYGLNISVNVDPIFCSRKEKPKFTTGYYISSSLFGIIVALVISATTHDVIRRGSLKKAKNETKIMEIFRAFSAIKNVKKLFKIDPKSDIIGIHFTKVFNILFVIYGHRYIFSIGYPIFNSETIEAYYKASSIELIHTNVVDAFFMVSGFLTFYFGVLPMKKGGLLFLVLSVVFRWIRMVPVFGLLLIFIINIMPYMSDGPLWNYRVYNEVEKCSNSWWANLLVVNNIVKTDQQCLVISWYISTDIQLAVVGAILLFIFCRHRKLGVYMSVGTFIIATGVTFVVAYINQFHGLLRLYMTLLEEPRNSPEFTNFYVATYARAGPYLVGFISAMITYTLKEKNYIFSNRQKYWIFILAVVVGEGSQFYGCLFYLFSRPYYRIESAAYASLNRSLYALPYAVCLCIYITSGFGMLQKIIDHKFFVPLGRLTYAAFLVNTVVQLIHASTQRTLMPTSTPWNLYWWAVADISFTYFFGFLLHIFAESPLTNISKMVQRQIISVVTSSRNGKNGDKNDSSVTDTSSNKSAPAEGETKENMQETKERNNDKLGFYNNGYVSNEIVPNISESYKF